MLRTSICAILLCVQLPDLDLFFFEYFLSHVVTSVSIPLDVKAYLVQRVLFAPRRSFFFVHSLNYSSVAWHTQGRALNFVNFLDQLPLD